MSNSKPNFNGYCFNCNKQGYQACECRSKANKTPTTSIFEGYCYICQKYGHKVQNFRSKVKKNWTPKGQGKVPKKGNTIYWDYNTWENCQYCGKYGHIAANFTRIHLRGRSRNWKKFGAVSFNCQVDNLRKGCMNGASAPNVEENNRKDKVNTEEVITQMNQTWKKKTNGGSSTNGEVVIIESNGLGDLPPQNERKRYVWKYVSN